VESGAVDRTVTGDVVDVFGFPGSAGHSGRPRVRGEVDEVVVILQLIAEGVAVRPRLLAHTVVEAGSAHCRNFQTQGR